MVILFSLSKSSLCSPLGWAGSAADCILQASWLSGFQLDCPLGGLQESWGWGWGREIPWPCPLPVCLLQFWQSLCLTKEPLWLMGTLPGYASLRLYLQVAFCLNIPWWFPSPSPQLCNLSPSVKSLLWNYMSCLLWSNYSHIKQHWLKVYHRFNNRKQIMC